MSFSSKFKFFALAFVSASMGFASTAFCGDVIPQITITNLPAGQTLSAFYSNGRPPALDMGGSNPVLRKVLQSATRKTVGSNGEVTLTATNIPNLAPFYFTNYVVLAVSPNAQPIYVNNSDGSVPTYPAGTKLPTTFTNLLNVRYIHLTDYPAGSPISFDFSQPLK